MAQLDLLIAGRSYELACRDGEEDHLRKLAALVDAKAIDAAKAMGGLGEVRQLLFAALLLADELTDTRKAPPGIGAAAAPAAASPSNPALANALERLAERMEALTGN